MSLAHGPKGVKSGLVFYYDSANRKSWVGAPTVNYAYENGFTQNGSGRTNPTLSEVPEIKQLKSRVGEIRDMTRIQNSETSWIDLFSVNNIPFPAGAYLYISCYVYIPDSKPTNLFNVNGNFGADLGTNAGVGAYGVSTQNVETGVWTRLVFRKQNTTASQITVNSLRIEPARPLNWTDSEIVLYYCNPQFEVGDIATPFVAGTRSTTQALLDLSKENTSINAGNLNFLSTGEFDFDGSSNYIPTGLFNGRDPSSEPFTVEAWVKSDVTSGARMWVDAGSNGSSQRFYCALIHPSAGIPLGIQGVGWSTSTPYDTEWHQQVIVMDGNTARAYCDGVEVHSRTYTPYTLPGHIIIGGRSSYYWNGKIDIARIYDRALSPTEVKENFEATRSRFGL